MTSEPIAKIEVPCCICGSVKATKIASGWDFEYETTRSEFSFVRCQNCDLVRLSPRPDNRELSRIYPPEYYAYDLKAHINPIAMKAKVFLESQKIRKFLSYCSTNQPRCLDVGCGDGRLLDMLAKAGVAKNNITGVELRAELVESLKQKGYAAFTGRIEDLDLPKSSFDLIYLLQVIEHVEDPKQLLTRLLSLLAPGGILILETPNVRSLDARIFRKRYWGGYHFPRHWNLFDCKTLAKIGKETGFSVIKIETFVCSVFWIFPFHHWLREIGLPRWLYRFFWPTANPILLGIATLIDIPLALCGASSNLRGVFVKTK